MAPVKALGVTWPGYCLGLQETLNNSLNQRQICKSRASELPTSPGLHTSGPFWRETQTSPCLSTVFGASLLQQPSLYTK